jgi:aspartate-semialdehyde dehydrogenase
VVPEVNARELKDMGRRNIVANPSACVTLMLTALKQIYDVAGLERVNAVTYQAVSGMGRMAVDELANQSMAIFNMKGITSKVYPKQIAFNVLSVIGELMENGYTREEMKMQCESRKILADQSLKLNATCVLVPVFYGHSLALHIETREKLSVEQARQLLEKSPGVKLVEGRKVDAFPTPVTEAVGTDAVYVGRIREDVTHPRGLDLWIVADNVRKGVALNSIQIAEILVKDYLG